ncbi:MAG: hypothetical protein FJ096_04925 [Deltaproteobacteria bacterium]|nr:hypothetical protein [Deltaproteobacteria bacterium]
MTGFDWRKVALGMAAVSALAVSCTQDFNSFQFKEPTGAGAGDPSSTSSTMGECSGPSGCPEAGVCMLATCITNKCGTQPATAGATCADNGGKVCDGNGACVECNKNSDCGADKPNCKDKKCVPNPCMNGTKDGDETDIDCGGATCPKCTAGDECLAPTDCDSNYCKGTGGGAGGGGGSAPTGPGVCEPCASDDACAATEYCKDKKTCVPKLDKAVKCTADGECLTGFCTDGVCCNARCNETCASCVAVKNGGNEGECGPVPVTDDPDMECKDSKPESCGPMADKGCSGMIGSCVVWPTTQACISASCDTTKNEQTAAANCDGMGACPPPTKKSCGDYVCNTGNAACFTNCTGGKEENCKLDAYCKTDQCTKCGANDPPGQVQEPMGCDAGLSSKKLCYKDCSGNACNAFVCPAGYDCTVNCAGKDVCKGATITCPDEFSCTVNCGADGACDGAKINPGKGGKLKVTCGNFPDSCKNTEVKCGVNECEVKCDGMSKPSKIDGCGATAADSCKCTKSTCM